MCIDVRFIFCTLLVYLIKSMLHATDVIPLNM
jgi:hypothetical protein